MTRCSSTSPTGSSSCATVRSSTTDARWPAPPATPTERASQPRTRAMTMPPLLLIAGATATGKTGLAIRLALALGEGGVPAEVVSADSRQVFRGLDIGTAKPTLEERQGVRHHGLDL